MPTITCQSCGAAIKFPSSKIGPPINCPACKAETPTVKPMTLPNPTNKSLPEYRPEASAWESTSGGGSAEDQMLKHLASINRNVATIKSIVLFWFVLGILGTVAFVFQVFVARH